MNLKISTALIFFLVLTGTIMTLLQPSSSKQKTPGIPLVAIQEIEHELNLIAKALGHVTEDGLKIPMIRLESYKKTKSIDDALSQYKKAYFELSNLMNHQSISINNTLFNESIPRICLSLVFADSSSKGVKSPYVSYIGMGPKGLLVVSSIDHETDRYRDIYETSLRELFKEELSLDEVE